MNKRAKKSNQLFTIAVLAIFLFSMAGCAPLTKIEETQYAKLLHEEIVSEPIQKKQKWAAGTLDFLIPGVGHFYLGEWGSGAGLFLSNIFWPLSPFWAAPAGVEATKNVNKRYTIEYYTLGDGQEIVASKKAEKCLNLASDYISVQKQNGKNLFYQNEITQYMFLQNCSSDVIKKLDWKKLEATTGSSISRSVQSGALTPEEKTKS